MGVQVGRVPVCHPTQHWCVEGGAQVIQVLAVCFAQETKDHKGEGMKDPEDEAFEELAMRQGHWQHTSGWRKKQIMDKIEQAFPNPHRTDMTGMTLRDYFAAKAMLRTSVGSSYEQLAKTAYEIADAMLKAREA